MLTVYRATRTPWATSIVSRASSRTVTSAYRRRGLARAVIEERLLRLQAMRLRRAAITGCSDGAVALYRSLGATRETISHICELNDHSARPVPCPD